MTVLVLGALIVGGAIGAIGDRQIRTSTTSSTTPSSTAPTTAIWPFASTATRFGDPALAVQTFATDYLGFTNPLVGSLHRKANGSDAIVVRSSVNSVATTVLVRQSTSAHTWWVLGSSAPDIIVSSPSTMQRISSPVLVKGTSTAYEAVVNVQLRQDGSVNPVTSNTVMGGSMGVMGPFSKMVSFPGPSSKYGALVFRTYSAKDGHVIEASTVRVSFAK